MSTFADNKKLTMIQLYGGPCVGKSTTAAELFAIMKRHNYKVEFIHEVAKGLVWDRADSMFYEQDWIFAHQHRLQRRLVDHDIKYAVTDTSLLLGLFYIDESFPQSLKPLIEETYNSYTNINIILKRNPDFHYDQTGRNQDLEQAKAIDQRIQDYFNANKIGHIVVPACEEAAQMIFDKLFAVQPVDIV